jgi:PAS domain S-box-containing protein
MKEEYKDKTKEQLINDLVGLRQRIAELEKVEAERKQLEAELLVKNEVFEASITANSTSDNEGILTYVNSAFIKIFGYENKEEAVGKPISDFLKFEDEAMNVITALNETGVWDGEYTGLRKDKTTFAAYGLATIIKDKSGDRIGYQSAVLDITDRKRMEETLRESEEKYSSVVGNSMDGIVILQKGIIKFLNQAILDLSGYNLDELIDKEFEHLLSPEYRKLVMDRHQSRLAGKDVPSMYEMGIIRKDGISVPIEVSTSTITFGGEEATLSFVRNITRGRGSNIVLRQKHHRAQAGRRFTAGERGENP